MLKYEVDPALAAAMPTQMLANLGINPMAKSHVSGYTRKDGTYVAEHEDQRVAASKPAKPVKLGAKAQERLNHIAKNHLGFDTLEERHSDRHDFKETSRLGWKSAIHAAHKAGYLHARGMAPMEHTDASHGSNEEAQGIAKEHGPFSDFKPRNSGEDFKEAHVNGVKRALHAAYSLGHSKGNAEKNAA